MIIKPMKLKAEEKPERKAKMTYKEVIEHHTYDLAEGVTLKVSASVPDDGEEHLPYVDMRIWADNEKYSGPTKKGFSFSEQQLGVIIEMLQEVQKDLKILRQPIEEKPKKTRKATK